MSDQFYYARDHERGTGAWCVRGPNFEMPVPDKLLAFAIGKLLSGNTEDAARAVEDWVRYGRGPIQIKIVDSVCAQDSSPARI